jgi:hypothetical protein
VFVPQSCVLSLPTDLLYDDCSQQNGSGYTNHSRFDFGTGCNPSLCEWCRIVAIDSSIENRDADRPT